MDVALIVARILVGLPFLGFGANHLLKREAFVGYASAKNVPAPGLWVPVTGVWQMVAALGVILGIYPLIATWMLIIWLVVVSIYMHRFWSEEGEMRVNDTTHFLKHVSWGAALFGLAVLDTWGPILVG